ncbi:hypothetical protein J5X84_44890, partial [Streptosporangiaceae bacterium NEAU-GS5]|nr:hypothetical protein [Streptosporangiaceae bacterium NEAU-GS5]
SGLLIYMIAAIQSVARGSVPLFGLLAAAGRFQQDAHTVHRVSVALVGGPAQPSFGVAETARIR